MDPKTDDRIKESIRFLCKMCQIALQKYPCRQIFCYSTGALFVAGEQSKGTNSLFCFKNLVLEFLSVFPN